MLLWPDIIVRKSDSSEILLAIDVKAGAVRAEAAAAPLKAYMVHQSCPAGIFVTPEEILFFRNLYTAYEPDTIRLIGNCRTSELLATIQGRVVSESILVQIVEHWLENLGTGGNQSWPPTAREAIESCVLPAVVGGVIRATGPRLRRTGS